MQFVVNNVPVELGSVAPDMTLLRYLRESRSLTGTKEGCASGDCGACTVLVGSEGPNGVVYQAVNSCICPLGSLHDQYVITVEGLGSDGISGAMHPVQEAMVSCHASQCGFCTPGFVMSLVGLHMTQEGSSDLAPAQRHHAILDAISGNLCRCTGYRPIIEAAIQALEKPAQMINIVQEWAPGAPLAGNPILQTGEQSYWQPTTEEELQNILFANADARLVAGGTDLMLEVTQLYKSFPKLIDLNRVDSLTRITISDESLEIGAAASYSEIEAALATISPAFVRLLGRLGSRQIRNRGTLGGNICNASPIADTPPILLVLDAELIIGNSAGTYRSEFLTDFYLDYKKTTLTAGEYLARVRIARSAFSSAMKLMKLSKRYEDDISAVMGAFLLTVAAAGETPQMRIAFGGMAGIPRRARAAEAELNQQVWFSNDQVDETVLARACEALSSEFSPMTDVRASAAYRMAMACNQLKKACYQFASEASGEPSCEGVFDHA